MKRRCALNFMIFFCWRCWTSLSGALHVVITFIDKNRHLINIKDVERSASSTEWKVEPIFSNVHCRNQLGKILHLLSSLLVVRRSVNCILAATAVLWGFCQRKSSFILHWEENAWDLLISGGGERCPVQLIQWSQYIINHKYTLIKSKTHSPVKGAGEILICHIWWYEF